MSRADEAARPASMLGSEPLNSAGSTPRAPSSRASRTSMLDYFSARSVSERVPRGSHASTPSSASNVSSLGRSFTQSHRSQPLAMGRPNFGGGREWSLFEEVLPAVDRHGRRSRNSPLPSPRLGLVASPESYSSAMAAVQNYLARRTESGLSNATMHAEGTTPKPTPAPLLSGAINEDPESFRQSQAEAATQEPPSPDEYDSDYSAHSDQHSDNEDVPEPKDSSWRASLPTLTRLQKNILKCSVAYLIGSLFTFVPYLSGFISDIIPNGSDEGPSPSAHMVATVAVYFNPAKSLGGMMEADIYCLAAALFSAFIALGSMSTFWFFELRHGWEWLADSLTFVWIAIGMMTVAWVKLWMDKPSFNPAASMASIIIFVVVVKEGGVETLLQVSFIVLIGSIISNLTCLILWPVSATGALQNDIVKTLSSFATVLQMLTQTFLLEEDLHYNHDAVLKAVESHQSSFTSLKKSLGEATSEWWDQRVQGEKTDYSNAVDSMTRLAQHLGGLRSGTKLQFELSRRTQRERQDATKTNGNGKQPAMAEADEEEARLAAAAIMFGDLVDDLEAPMNALASTCTRTLKKMRTAFLQDKRTWFGQATRPPANSGPHDAHDFDRLAANINRALFTFERTSNHALMRLYTRSEVNPDNDSGKAVNSGDTEESMFLIYFFIFTLQEFARELVNLVEIMGTIHDFERVMAQRALPVRMKEMLRPLAWNPRSWFRTTSHPSARRKRPTLRKRISTLVPIEPRKTTTLFPRIQPHAPNTGHLPSRQTLSVSGRLKQSFWATFQRLRQPDMKYSIKTGVATAILALPSVVDSTRPLFMEYRGEWALISFFVVMSKTIGATNALSTHRIMGTIIGATAAAVVSTFFPHMPMVLAAFGFLFSIPCFYIIVGMPQYGTSGRFVLLTYNLTCLYCYNLRSDELSVWSVAWHRAAAVTVGVVWAFIVSRWWWPSEARRELSNGLSDFCLNISWLYTALVRSYSMPPPPPTRNASEDYDTDNTSLLGSPSQLSTELNSSIKKFMAMELHLQLKLIELQGLLSQTQHEPRLKGPFPVALYRKVLASLQTVLDNLHSMRCVTTREEWLVNVRKDFVVPVNKERREMVGNVILYFSTLSAAFRIKAPLPPYLPPAEQSRRRLVEAIKNLDVVKRREVRGSNSKQLIYVAYALMMKGVIAELDFLGRTLQEAFGVVGSDIHDFDLLFKPDVEGGLIDADDARA